MILEKNVRGFSMENNRRINITYFFVEDIVNSGEVKIKYCPKMTWLRVISLSPYKVPSLGNLGNKS